MGRTPGEDDVRRVYRRTIDPLYGFVALRCDGDRDLADDIVQETWLRAVRAWHGDGLPENPLAWLCTVAARLLSNHRRRAPMSPLDERSPSADAERLESRERRSLVERALARLPALQGRLLEAFHFERRSVAELAASAGLSERAVEGRLRRARQKLRQEIGRDPQAEEIAHD